MDVVRKAITGLLRGKPGGAWEGGIRAYHSSPHDFDKVDFSKLRTGEGANVYGAGHYMAENPAVSGQGGQYWQQFAGSSGGRFPPHETSAAGTLFNNKFDRDAAMAETRRNIEDWKSMLAEKPPAEKVRYYEKMLAQREAELALLEGGGPVGPRTYEMNLRAKPEELLDWDKPARQQSSYVQERLVPDIEDWNKHESVSVLGKDLYRRLHSWDKPDTYATDQLRDLGIPGIRYLDEGSRTLPYAVRQGLSLSPDEKFSVLGRDVHRTFATREAADEFAALKNADFKPTYNYVGVDPSKLDILAKYGVAGAVAGPTLGAFTRQDNYEEAR